MTTVAAGRSVVGGSPDAVSVPGRAGGRGDVEGGGGPGGLDRVRRRRWRTRWCAGRVASGSTRTAERRTPRLPTAGEQVLADRVLALSVGLGPVELLLADPTVEEIVATRFDLVFVYRSDGTVEELDERLWASEGELVAWLAHLARTAGRTERQFNWQVPLLVMRLGDGLRLAACRDVSAACVVRPARNTTGKVTLPDLVRAGDDAPGVGGLLGACMRSPSPPGRSRSDRRGQDDAGAGLSGRAAPADEGGHHRGHRRARRLRCWSTTRTSSRGRPAWPTTRAKAPSRRPAGEARARYRPDWLVSGRCVTPTLRCRW